MAGYFKNDSRIHAVSLRREWSQTPAAASTDFISCNRRSYSRWTVKYLWGFSCAHCSLWIQLLGWRMGHPYQLCCSVISSFPVYVPSSKLFLHAASKSPYNKWHHHWVSNQLFKQTIHLIVENKVHKHIHINECKWYSHSILVSCSGSDWGYGPSSSPDIKPPWLPCDHWDKSNKTKLPNFSSSLHPIMSFIFLLHISIINLTHFFFSVQAFLPCRKGEHF